MMEPESGPNPYAYTQAASVASEELPASAKSTPTRLAVLTILLLLMGGWGIVGSAIGGAGAALQMAIVSMPPGNETSERGAELERQFRANMALLTPFTCGSVAASFLLSIPMFVGAIGLTRKKEWARALTVRTIYVNAVFSVLEMLFAAVAFYLQSAVMLGQIEEAAAVGPLGSGGRILGYALVIAQIVVLLLVYAYEFAVYWFGVRYLKRDDVRGMFA